MTRIRPFYGWYIIFCCFSMAFFAWGLGFYGPSVYLLRLRETQGWSTSSISTALTFYNVLIAVVVLHVGDVVQRIGPRPVVFAGSLALGAGVALLPLVQEPWQLYIAVVPMALGFATTNGASINVIIARWFEAKRGLAISLAFNGASAAGILVTPLMLALTTSYGFATGLWLLALAMLAVLWAVLVVLLRARPEDLGLAVDGAPLTTERRLLPVSGVTRTAIVSDMRFFTVTTAFSLGLAAQVGFLTHQVSYVSSHLGIASAGASVSITTAAALAGRLATGIFVDRFDVRVAAAANFLLQASALVLLALLTSPHGIRVACFLFGLSVGNMITLPTLILQREFPAEQFPRVISLHLAITQAVLAFGPGMLGALHDWTGRYEEPLLACVMMNMVASLAIFSHHLSGRRDRSVAEP